MRTQGENGSSPPPGPRSAGSPQPLAGLAGHALAGPASASPEEAAAVVAALERFMRATAPAPSAGPGQPSDGWRRAAILEGVQREPEGDVRNPWINT
jgi:hypothetical protein